MLTTPPAPTLGSVLPALARCLPRASGLLSNAGESVMDLADKWPCLLLTGIREQDYGIDPQCVSAWTCVFRTKVWAEQSSQEGRGAVSRAGSGPFCGGWGQTMPT